MCKLQQMSLSAKNLPFGFQNASLVSLSHSGAQLLAPLCGALGVGAVSDLQIQSHPSRDIQCYLHLRLSWHCQFKSICMYEQKMVPENVTTKSTIKGARKWYQIELICPFSVVPSREIDRRFIIQTAIRRSQANPKLFFYIADLLFKYI